MLLGIDKRTITARVNAILRFAELEEYRTYPVRALSSGMMARLGFSIATEIAPDILLIDEALAVGDESFRVKSPRSHRPAVGSASPPSYWFRTT